MKKILFLLGIIGQIAFGQDTIKRHTISLGGGLLNTSKKDRVYSILKKQGELKGLDLRYQYENKKNIINTRIHIFQGILNTPTNTINKVKPEGGGLFIKYLREIDLKIPKIKIYGGGQMAVRADLWFPAGNVFRYGWDLNAGLDISGRVCYFLSPKFYFCFDTDLHLLGILWRPHKNGQQLSTEKLQLEKGTLATATENGYLSTPINSFYWSNRLMVHFNMTPFLGFFVASQIDYLYVSPPTVKEGSALFTNIGISFMF